MDEGTWAAPSCASSSATGPVFVTLFVGGLGLSALAPTTKPQIEVVRTDGTALCGDRLSVTAAAIALRTRGVDIVVPENQIAAIRAVARCGS